MTRSASATLMVALALGAGAPASRPPPLATGRVTSLEIPAPSLRQERHSVLVYLPRSYDRPESATRRYPLLVFLHGEPGWNGDWPNRGRIGEILDRLTERHSIPEVIALMPDANGPGPGGRSLYMNSWDGRLRMEDFIVNDLIGWADRRLRTRAAASERALVGISDGANAALNLAFKHPDRFGACAGHSGEYEWKREPRVPQVLGPEPGASRLLAANSPVRYVERVASHLKSLVIYFDSGLLDAGFLDDRTLDRMLTRLGVPHVYREYWGWHDWPFWRKRFEVSLPIVTRRMTRDRQGPIPVPVSRWSGRAVR